MSIGLSPQRFRSRFTGPQIETMLASVPTKLSLSHIVNDFTGGKELVASAESVKNIFLSQTKFSDPNYIRSLILSIPGALVYTQTDKDRIEALGGTMRGTFPDEATRNISVDTIGFKGGELTFVVTNVDGNQELSYWDINTAQWKRSNFNKSPSSLPVALGAAGAKVALRIDRKFDCAKYSVRCDSSSDFSMFELMIGVKGVNTYWTTVGHVGSNNSLITVNNATLSTGFVDINVTVQANVTVKFYRLMEY